MVEKDSYKNYEEIFKKGSIVEVSSEDEGLRGSWYTATVIRTISRKTNKILVQYHNLMSDSSSCSKPKPLTEYVPALLVRPIPPPRQPPHIDIGFSLMDDVDAFHNDGWWEGVVTNIIPSPSPSPSSLFSVFFPCSREQIHFCPSDLRFHLEWVPNGNFWVPSLDNFTHPSPSPSPGQRNGRISNHSSGDNERVITRNGRSSNRSVNNGTIKKDDNVRISSNGTCKRNGVTSNGTLKRKRTSM